MHFAKCNLFVLFLIFRFSVLLEQLLRSGQIVTTPKLNTDQHEQNKEFFSLKYGSTYIDLNHLEKRIGSVFFTFRAMLFYLYLFKKISFFCVFRAILSMWAHCTHPQTKYDLKRTIRLICEKIRVFRDQY